MTARFSIGIDLGTTNSALATVPLATVPLATGTPAGDDQAEPLIVAQWETPTTLAHAPMLPSFLYLPEDAVQAQLRSQATGGHWVVGRLARRRAGEAPGRVVRSAKSWLCHHTADRAAPILPWGSEELSPAQKISPVHASALILGTLRDAWNSQFGPAGHRFEDQDVTVTVPASFDAAAQRLTLDAAAQAGFPTGVRLLEEPQAAFYRWLDQAGAAETLAAGNGPSHVLIVDIGGGTSDFSLFELRPTAAGGMPDIRRVAVSDHILLGGDNIDLALAAALEPRLAGDRGEMSGPQWDHLVALSRDLKERALAEAVQADQRFTVSLPGRGSGLLAGAQSVSLTRAEVEHLVLDGFFPACDAQARPFRAQAGLRDWGLPYAADGAVTRHLADFLRDRPRVDFVLFNGGSLAAPVVRRRLLDQVAFWQGGLRPVALENPDADLAVARGAARFGKLLHHHASRIAAGSARAVFLQVHRPDQAASLVCVLPRNAPPEQVFDISLPGLEVRTDQLVSFQACSSTRHGRARAGDLVAWDREAFQALPPLQTIIRVPGASVPGAGISGADVPGTSATEASRRGNGSEGTGTSGSSLQPMRTDDTDASASRRLPVRLAAKMNALGLLQVSCVSTDPNSPHSWPLEFNLRPQEQGIPEADSAEPVAPNATTEAQQAAREHLSRRFSRPAPKTDRLTANTILKDLEGMIGLPRHQWNAALLRGLWPALADRMDGRGLSVEHEEAWLTLAGFLLRPGFGFPHDTLRMNDLWRLHSAGLRFPGRRSRVHAHILWRRVAGGLTAEQQEALLASEQEALRTGKASPELVRLAGSLERLSRESKSDLVQTFLNRTLQAVELKQHCAPYLTALGLLLTRVPLYGGPEAVLPPDAVARTYAALKDFDWAEAELQETHMLFLRAARVVDDRNLDVPKSLRNQIARRLESAGVPAQRTASLKAFTPIGGADRSALYGEALPAGLVIGAEPVGR